MKNFINIWICAALFVFASCSEDINSDPELGGPLYGLSKGEPGSVEELVYNTWEYCGVYYLYDYNQFAFQVSNWSGYFNKWYTPIKEENKEMIKDVVNTIQQEVFAGMDGDFIRRNWFVRVFLCDSLCNNYDYSPDDLVETYLENEDMLIIPNIGDRMKGYTEKDWTTWKEAFSNLLISRLYLGATEQPTAFLNLRYKDPKTGKEVTAIFAPWENDPKNEYSPDIYTFRNKGYIRSKPDKRGKPTVIVVDRQLDVSDYINFLTGTTKTELNYVFGRFPKILERTIAIVPYLTDILGLDIVKMQNTNCPDDRVEADFFKNLKM